MKIYKITGGCVNKMLRVLNFLRLIDANGLLSLTNICVIVIIVKLAMAHDLDFASVAALVGALSGYSYKRWVEKDKDTKPTSSSKLEELSSKVDKLTMAVGLKR